MTIAVQKHDGVSSPGSQFDIVCVLCDHILRDVDFDKDLVAEAITSAEGWTEGLMHELMQGESYRIQGYDPFWYETNTSAMAAAKSIGWEFDGTWTCNRCRAQRANAGNPNPSSTAEGSANT